MSHYKARKKLTPIPSISSQTSLLSGGQSTLALLELDSSRSFTLDDLSHSLSSVNLDSLVLFPDSQIDLSLHLPSEDSYAYLWRCESSVTAESGAAVVQEKDGCRKKASRVVSSTLARGLRTIKCKPEEDSDDEDSGEEGERTVGGFAELARREDGKEKKKEEEQEEEQMIDTAEAKSKDKEKKQDKRFGCQFCSKAHPYGD